MHTGEKRSQINSAKRGSVSQKMQSLNDGHDSWLNQINLRQSSSRNRVNAHSKLFIIMGVFGIFEVSCS